MSGSLGPLLNGATAALVLAPVAADDGVHWVLVEPGPAVRVEPLPSFDPSRRSARWSLADAAVPAGRVLARTSTRRIRDLTLVVVAAEACGGARWCLDTAAEHARTRHQFGRPIGQFQGVKHRLADLLVAVEQAVAATWDAASLGDHERSEDGEGAQARLAIQLAATLAVDGYVEAAKGAIQVLGGMGFTWEHDAHIHLRRATTLRQLIGGTAPLRAGAARLALEGWRRRLTVELPPEAERLREQLAPVVASIAALPDPAGQRRALADEGLLAPHWPAPFGRDAGAVEQLVIDQLCAEAGLRRPNLAVAAWALPTIMAHGTPEQTERFVGPTLRGEIVWCQLFSEPGAGSDLAALSTRATRADGGWSLEGQKVWTSVATRAHMGICLARTDPDGPKHRGITYFLVDMASPGIEVRPLREITGEALFNEVFFDGCFVPDDCVVGEVDGGWRLARTTLANERVSLSTDTAFGGALEEVLARVTQRPDAPGSGHPGPPGPTPGRCPVPGPAGDAGHPSFGGGPAARLGIERAEAPGGRVRAAGPRVRPGSGRTVRGGRLGGRCRVGPRRAPQQVSHHRRRDQRGPAQRDRRAAARPAPGSRAGSMTGCRGAVGPVGPVGVRRRAGYGRMDGRPRRAWPPENGGRNRG